VGEEDKLYGSVTASDVQRKLEELGIHVDKRRWIFPSRSGSWASFASVSNCIPTCARNQVSVVKE